MTLEFIRQLLRVPSQTIDLPEGPCVDFEEWLQEIHGSGVCTHKHGCKCAFCSKARAVHAALEEDFNGTVFQLVGGM